MGMLNALEEACDRVGAEALREALVLGDDEFEGLLAADEQRAGVGAAQAAGFGEDQTPELFEALLSVHRFVDAQEALDAVALRGRRGRARGGPGCRRASPSRRAGRSTTGANHQRECDQDRDEDQREGDRGGDDRDDVLAEALAQEVQRRRPLRHERLAVQIVVDVAGEFAGGGVAVFALAGEGFEQECFEFGIDVGQDRCAGGEHPVPGCDA